LPARGRCGVRAPASTNPVRGQVTLDTPLTKVVGGSSAKALSKQLDLDTVGDLVYHVPRRYEERGEHTDIAGLHVGDHVTIQAVVLRAQERPLRNKYGQHLLEAIV